MQALPSCGRAVQRPVHRLHSAFLVVLLLLVTPCVLRAGQVRGKVVGPGDEPLPGVMLTLSNDLTGFSQQTQSAEDGSYAFYNVPENPYHLRAAMTGFQAAHVDVDVRGNVPVQQPVKLAAQYSETTTVTAEKESVELETDASTTHIDIDKSLVRRFAAPVASRAFEAIVLSTPGFSQDENGRYHFQGGHSQQLLVIDGQPIGDQVGITFSNSLDPAVAEGVEIVTGGVPPEYGEKAYGVINLTTRSALGHPGFHGDVTAGGGRFSTSEEALALGWGGERQGLFADVDHSQSDRFLDPVSFDSFHNHGRTERLFGRYDLISPAQADSLRLTGNAGRTDRDVPNLPSQQEAGQDQRVESRDWNLNLGYEHVANEWVADAQVYGRNNTLRLLGSANDTPVLATQDRSLENQGGNLSLTRVFGAHEVKVGAQAKRFPIRETFSFGLTDPGFNDPDAEEGYNPNLAPYDLTRGGDFFHFHGERTGSYYAAYAQDTMRFGNLTINAGLRYGHNHLFESESLAQPRVGIAYYVAATKTVLRAAYDRMFITPEYENILLGSSAAAAALVPPEIQDNSQLGKGQLFNPSERQKSYNFGLQQGLGSALRADLSYWKRDVDNAADQDQFFNTGIVFPLNFARGELSGWNARLDGGPWHGLRGYASLGHVHALYVNPFVGGLFLDAEALDSLQGGAFLIDHDQDLQEQVGAFWDIPGSGFWLGVTQRYDSGLVADAGVLEDVLASPDTAYAAPYLRFDEDPQRVKSRDIWNFSVGAHLQQYHLPFEVQVDLLNATDEKGLYNFQSVFGGTHVIPPRTLAARVRYVF